MQKCKQTSGNTQKISSLLTRQVHFKLIKRDLIVLRYLRVSTNSLQSSSTLSECDVSSNLTFYIEFFFGVPKRLQKRSLNPRKKIGDFNRLFLNFLFLFNFYLNMNRESIYFLPDGAPGTFDNDDKLASLPLPSLEDTLERYYRNLLPFATEQELAKTRQIIEDFKNGAGKNLHKILAEKARKEKNWVNNTEEDYF